MSGMKVTFDDNGAIADITDYVSQIQDKLSDENIKKCLKEIGNTVKKNVAHYAPKTKINHTHIKDDVKSQVKKSKSANQYYVSISGGKNTGYKWLWVNDGHIAQNGKKVPGNHFADKAEVASESAVDEIVDRWLKGIMQ